MPEPFEIDEMPYELKVNGLPVRSVHIRRARHSVDDFQVVITDPQIGSFSLNEGFKLETREDGASWHLVTLEQLKKTLAEHSEHLRPADLPKSSERAELQLLGHLEDVDIRQRSSPRVDKIAGHARCVTHVQAVLYEAGIPHQVSGTVFLVPDAGQARIALIRAGFEHSPISPGAFVEPGADSAIYLLERPRSGGRSRGRN
jgi:hypothetical protein